MEKNKTIRVAAIQAISRNGQISKNLAHAEPFVMKAKAEGAELILLPEFFATGYNLSQDIWNAAEPHNGPTVQWLKDQSIKKSVWIGTSFLEARDNDFYNTFVLVNDKGKEAIRVRKSKPAATESFFYKGVEEKRVVDTPFGRVGVGICYENTFASTMQSLRKENADLVLMPMSAPTPTLNKPLTERDIEEYDRVIKSIASDVASELGVPAVMANKAGSWETDSPWPFPKERSEFPGYSAIVASDGKVITQLANQEGVIIEDVILTPTEKTRKPLKSYNKWARKPPRMFKLFVISETLGTLRYFLSLKRRAMAKKVAAGHDLQP